MDSLMKSVNNHYTHEVKKIQLNITKNRDGSSRFYKIFNNLLIYSNDLMMIYEHAVKMLKQNWKMSWKSKIRHPTTSATT